MKIGTRLKDLRLFRKFTLKELARITNLTISFLSQLERNVTSPSLKSLRKIAQALKVKVAYFFEEGEVKDFVFIKNATHRRVDKKLKAFRQTLISDLLNVKMQPQLFSLKKGAKVEDKTNQAGEEFGFIFKGNIVLFRKKQKFIMKKGDFIYFISIKPKKLSNIGKDEALILWTQWKES